ncbi:erythromycin esterase family protein [Streptomyces sp. NPDC049602]|uniref:erythromycin esterase family protein n=1 Tax=Streptomyces sp. NPDC049602 TaxID=3155504 RepID=UPI0034435704
MPPASDRTPFTDWLRGHATPLSHLDPAAPLDDLEPLRDILDGARVVALGEHCHFIDEFAAMRRRILRFPIEHCGFTVLAFEYGFCEAIPLDAWAQGQGADDDLSALLATAAPIGLQEAARLIRRHNRTAAAPVRFAGIDIPSAGRSLLPALTPVAAFSAGSIRKPSRRSRPRSRSPHPSPETPQQWPLPHGRVCPPPNGTP